MVRGGYRAGLPSLARHQDRIAFPFRLAHRRGALLSELPKVEGNPHVICGAGAGHYVGLQKIWVKVRNSADLPDVRLHDLRHSFASMGARSGESLLIIGKVLGHATATATGRYAHLSDDPLRVAAERIGQEVNELMTSGSQVNRIAGSVKDRA